MKIAAIAHFKDVKRQIDRADQEADQKKDVRIFLRVLEVF
jgi:hypothetical protein